MHKVTQHASECPPEAAGAPPSSRRKLRRDETAAAYAAARGDRPPPFDAPLASSLLHGLGAGIFEQDAGSAGLPILAEVLSTLNVLLAAQQMGGMDDSAENDWGDAMRAVQARLTVGFELVHRELQEHRAAAEQDEDEGGCAAAPMVAEWQKVAALLEKTRESVDTVYETAGLQAAIPYLGALESLRAARTTCLYYGGAV